MLQLSNHETTYKWKVTINQPQPDGTVTSSEITCFFKFESMEGATLAQTRDKEFLRRVWVDWAGIKDVDGSAFTFSEENREALLKVSYITRSVIEGYFDFIQGIGPKN